MTGPEATAAVKRAAFAMHKMPFKRHAYTTSDVACEALAAALDVEEMTDTLARVRFEQMRESFQMIGTEWPDAPEFMREKFLVLARPFATALRAALIGEGS